MLPGRWIGLDRLTRGEIYDGLRERVRIARTLA
jgi:hypothetical protein